MASYTITNSQYITALTLKTGGDTYNIDGGTLIIDADSRWAQNATALTGALGGITVSSTVGGSLVVTTEFTKVIPYTSGSGLVPASGTVITQGTASGVLLCVMQTKMGDVVHAAGAAMPASAYIKVRVTSPGFVAGALSGITADASGPEEQSWIIVVGQENLTHTHSRLGTMYFRGDWIECGTTTGTAGQSIQLPFFTAESAVYYPGVEIETAPGSGVYQYWPNAGMRHTSVNSSTDTRSSFVYITSAGVVWIGRGSDSSTCGYVPVAGCKVRIPSIILQNCTLIARQTNVEPSRNMGTRYESAFTNAGLLNVSKVTGAWYWNVIQPYSIYIRDLHVSDNILLGECATAMDIDNLHQGLSTSATDFASNGIVIQQSYNGGTIGTMSWLRAASPSTSSYSAIIVNCYGGWTVDKLRGGNVGRAAALSGSLYVNTCGPMVVNEIRSFTKRILIQAADNLRISKIVYADDNVGTTDTIAQSRAVETVGQCVTVVVNGIENWPNVANTHPYLALGMCNTTKKFQLLNCGTPSAPYNAGTVNIMGYIWDDGGNNDNIKIQRNWTTALRLGLHGGTNTTKRLTSVNNYMVDASKTIGPQQLDSFIHGNRFNSGGVPGSYSAVYGTCMWDGFTGDTTTRAALILVEKSLSNPDAYQITGGSPKFTGAGRCIFLTVGDRIEWTWQWKILGWTGLASFAVTGSNTANHLYEYSLDKDGSGFGAWKTMTNLNLLAETGIDPVVGLGLKMRITCTTANSTNRIDSLRIDGTTTLAIQNAALYPLEAIGLTISGISPGSDVVIYAAGTDTVLDTGDAVGADYTYSYTLLQPIDIGIFKSGYRPKYIRNYTLQPDPTSIPISQDPDRNYL
jgi:hypothetical protein